MSPADTTPTAVLFQLMKQRAGLSHKELASLILSGKPLADGRSPQSRIADRTWVSRFIVHAPKNTLSDNYFCDYSVAALRVVSRLKSNKKQPMTSQEILDIACGREGEAMDDILRTIGQDPSMYRNMLQRISADASLSLNERSEIAMVLLITVGCTSDVRRSVTYARAFAQKTFGGRLATPKTIPVGQDAGEADGEEGVAELAEAANQDADLEDPQPVLGLLTVEEDGLIKGAPFWLSPDEVGNEIGAFALSENAINKVGKTVSGHHARVWLGEDDQWFVEGLESLNGTVLIRALDGKEVVVEPPLDQREDFVSKPVPLMPGDQLRLGETTTFVVVKGFPQ